MSMLSLNPHAVTEARGVETTLWALTGISAALLLGSLAASVPETRVLDGQNLWVKPAKFALSFLVLWPTLALVAARLSPAVREGRAARWTVAVMAASFLGEMAYIVAQAGRGVRSHWNETTWVNEVAYALMGLGALALVAGVAVFGWLAGRDREARLTPALRAAVRTGFILSAGLTVAVAGYMSAGSGHFVGTPSPGAATIPFTGWSAEVGDLRPAHFLALHAMQALPLLTLWLDRRGTGSVAAVRGAAVLYAGLTLAVFAQALMGLPLVRL